MAVTLINPLPSNAFSKNPIVVVLESDDYIDTAGVNAVVAIVFKDVVPVGQTIPLVWANANLTLTAAGTPDKSGNQYPSGAGDAPYVSGLISILKKNYYIDRDFTLSTGSISGFPALILTARDTGEIYNIAEVTGSIIDVDLTTDAVNEELQANFAHHLEIWIDKGAGFVNIYDNQLDLDYPINGITTKDISEILNPYVDGIVPENSDRPALNITTWQLCNNSTLRYFIRYAEYFGDQPMVQLLESTDPVFVNYGGLDIESALNQTLPGYISPGTDKSKTLCLRQGSKTKFIQVDQPEWLYWINLTGGDIDIKLSVQVFYDGGGSGSFVVSPQTAIANNKYAIAVGYNQLNIDAHLPTGKQCAYYTAAIISSSDNNYLSALYSYVADQYREFARYFIYLNSLGGYQTLCTWGKGQKTADRSKTDVVKQVDLATSAISGSTPEVSIRRQDKLMVNTGLVSKRDIDVLNDLIVSPEIYYYTGTKLVPVGLTTTTIEQAVDGTNINGVQLDFYVKNLEDSFTDDLTLPDNQIVPGAAFGTNEYDAIWDDDNNGDDIVYDDDDI